MNDGRHLARIGAVAAISGSVIAFIASALHPMSADPNDLAAAFAEYAADSWWVGTHLGQFAGIALLGAALIALAATLETGKSAAWARLGTAGTAASIAMTAALQAVDGVALKVMVDRWSRASGDAQLRAFEAAFAVRQVEVGLASLLSLTFGLTVVVFAIAMLHSTRYSKWLGVAGAAGGMFTIAAGVAQASTGFSALAMMLIMPSGVLLFAWAFVLGIAMWRLSAREAERRTPVESSAP
jgi:hypothetical protein